VGPCGFFLSNPLCFGVERGESHERLDPRFHHPRFHSLHRLSHYPTLGSISIVVTKGESPLWRGDDFVSEGVPFIKAENISDQSIHLEDVDHVTPEVHARMRRSQLKPGHVVLSMAGTIGVAAVIPETLPEANTNQDLAKIVLKSGINPHYVATFLNSDLGCLQTERLSTGTTRQHINFEQIKSIQIPIPDRTIQDAIADKMDAAYQRKQELEAKVKALLESIDGYVLDQVGHDWGADPPTAAESAGPAFFTVWRHNTSRLDPKRYRWQSEIEDTEGLQHLGELLIPRRDKVDRDEYEFEDLQLITLHFEGTIEPRDVPSWRTDIKGTLYFAHPGDLVYSKIDARNGAIGLVPDELGKVAVTSEYPVYQVQEDVILPAYLKMILRSSRFTALLKALASGHSGRKRIYPDTVEDIYMPVPTIEKQREIAEEVQRRRERATILQEEAERVVAEAKAEVERMILGEGEARPSTVGSG
jgi:type I restriction enzyme S subunit